MNIKSIGVIVGLLLLGLTISTNAVGKAGPKGGSAKQYTYTELPYIGEGYRNGAGDAWVADINDLGQVTGTTREINGSFLVRAFFWSEDKGLQLIENDPPNQGITRGHDINNKGEVVGYGVSAPPSVTLPFIWSELDGLAYLKLPPGYNMGAVESINNKGEMIGEIWTGYSGGTSEEVIWKNSGETPMVIDRGSFDYLALTEISENGMVAGQGYGNPNGPLAITWTKKKGLQILDPPYLAGDVASGAADLNQNKAIVGYSREAYGTDYAVSSAVLWSKKGKIQDLGVLSGKEASAAFGINNAKEIVGISFNYVYVPSLFGYTWGSGRAFLWTKKTQMLDLNDLVVDLPADVVLNFAVAINNQGQIAVEGFNTATGKTVFSVLTPVAD